MKLNILFALLLFPLLVLAQGTSRGAASLKLPTTPFVAATGESFIADPTSLHSILVNPANIASRSSYDVMFSHTEWLLDSRTEFLVLAAPLRLGSLSLALCNTSWDGFEVREVPGPAIGTFNFQSAFLQLTYGVELTETIRIGIAPKYLYEKIYVDETTGYGIDAGVLYTPPVDGLILGASLTGLGSLAAYRTERIDLPSQIRLGGTYSFSAKEVSFRTAAAFSSELGVSLHHMNIGAEASYNNIISVRLGYKTGIAIYGFSAGIGIRYSIAVIDYAYVPFNLQVGNAHIISIGFIL
jgi:hypothetical protein